MNSKPPTDSYVDNNGKRWIDIKVDIMTRNGDRFFRTHRCTAPVVFSFDCGWNIDLDSIRNCILNTYTSLQDRKDVVICLNDVKIIHKQTNHSLWKK